MGNDISIRICARLDTGKFKDGNYSHMLSLLDPQGGFEGIVVPDKTRHLGRLMFNDLDDIEVRAPKYFSYIPPTRADIERIMEFFRRLKTNKGTGILIHCEAGISRSAAAAIVGLCGGLNLKPEVSFDYVLRMNEMGLPNRRMLRLADEVLGYPNTLARLAEHHRQELFRKYEQPDPLESLKNQLDRMSRRDLTKEYICEWGRSVMRTCRSLAKLKRPTPRKPSRFIKDLR